MQIDSLTPEQEAKLEVYYQKWLAIGLAIEDFSTSDAEITELVAEVYRAGGLPPPAEVVVVADPIAAQRAAQSRLGSSSWVSMGNGQHDAGWLSYYDYCREVLGLVEETQELVPLMELSKRVGWFAPLSDVCYVSRRPFICNTDAAGNLHGDRGPALIWGQLTYYAMHGVEFTTEEAEQFILPAPEDIDPKAVLALTNVEKRAVVMTKVGVAKFLDALKPKQLDSAASYQLLELYIGNQRRVYLKMQNPSIDETHLEAVHPDCKSVAQALNWRNWGEPGTTLRAPEVLT